ncbi:MAG: aminotransferase class I/II-fold pyridoxal phosphate-dependent enzyme [Peptoclostridium sp.]|uniref:threonine aldolase family protein n=1 Tax=Peptoclostridium sp. TaxID=1904860 RepID=UPI00139C61A0|nr:low specificity L-threonine aldolase [Peptoclostridium sp.]MZQ75776.1 aminotransferase class I/II-fold pyridoxal phosphate-dependent enzyme [Peptoclostridium sp.]
MIRFECDYAEGAHPKILEKMVETNFEQTPGYGVDEYCESARNRIKQLCGNDKIDVHFLVGGTQTNMTVIASMLRPHQGVISANTGHVNVHETGAIEATGHKVLTVASADGKITAGQVRKVYEAHWNDVTHEHMVQPGMVYISHPTENGTTYTKAELEALSKVCSECQLPLFMDGARLGYGLEADGSDLTLKDIAKLTDIFYIGGTKVGALFGEAVVISNDSLKKDFRYLIKQRGGMLAKGRLLGIQFDVLFNDNLYFEVSKHAVKLAMLIRNAFNEKGYKFLYDSHTNQQFPIIPNDKLEILSQKYSYSFWERIDEKHTAVRFCTSWATREEDVKLLIADIESL